MLRLPRTPLCRLARTAAAVLLASHASLASMAATPDAAPSAGLPDARAEANRPDSRLDSRLLDARDALRKRDRKALAALRDELVAARHPLAPWADYWELGNRLTEASQPELEAFYARWPGSYVEDRLRNDWLLELGRRRDWRNFMAELPRFRMADDREVACYALVARQQQGEDVRSAARSAWLAQREPGEGCGHMATVLVEARQLGPADIWAKARQAAEANRPKVAREAVALLGDSPADRAAEKTVAELWDQPLRHLARREPPARHTAELAVLALARLAATDPATAAGQLEDRWAAQLPPDAQAWAWGAIGKQAAWKLLPEADGWFQRAADRSTAALLAARDADLGDDTQAWRARAALRATDPGRWQRVADAIAAMSPAARAEPTWVYWAARAHAATARPGAEGEGQRLGAQVLLERIAGQPHFYGKLAAEELGRVQVLPPKPAPLTPEERRAAERHPGLNRALHLIAVGLRSEGVREWNFSIRELGDRELLAAAQRACDREIWDRCINTSERTRQEIDMAQRFPTPWRAEVVAAATEAGLEPAFIYGLIRQESRFIVDARSSVGAAGLMQLMPATAKWTARKIGLSGFTADQVTDRATNLRLGAGYLKLLVDDFEGSHAMATAAYNAGPNRPRRWRDGPTLEVAAWAENIPFNETRDYVKKVLSNASYYAALMGQRSVAPLKARLGNPIAPRTSTASTENRDLP